MQAPVVFLLISVPWSKMGICSVTSDCRSAPDLPIRIVLYSQSQVQPRQNGGDRKKDVKVPVVSLVNNPLYLQRKERGKQGTGKG